jgi:hypothetical protein
VAFYKGVDEVNSTYKDNFWKTLPIEPIEVDTRTFTKDDKDELGLDAQIEASSPNFQRAEEKAVKAVQKHSMLIGNKEYNSKIDDAYLLLGKSRYYSSRFIPALEAFNYTLRNYQSASLINETKVWQAKTLVRLNNSEQAVENLSYMLTGRNLKENITEQGNTALAMAFVKLDSVDKVIYHLKKAAKTIVNREQSARNFFILGQLYRQKKKIDSSLVSFQRVLKIKWIPRKYKLHARLQIASNELMQDGLIKKANKNLLRMTKNYDYKSYLGVIYYQLGLLNKTIDTTVAIKYYNKALKDKSVSVFEQELAYQELGNIYFDKAEFLTAGKYFDSILQISTDSNSKRVRKLKRKREKLDDIIKNESIAKKNDSILAVLSLSQEAQIAQYNSKRKEEGNDDSLIYSEFTSFEQFSANSLANSKEWYFYNPKVASRGQQEFIRIWGNRLLEDNWRIGNKQVINIQQEVEVEIEQQIDQNEDLEQYLEEIKQNKERIKEITEERNYAYLSLGIMYKEQFNEELLAIDKLEKLIAFEPKDEIELLAKYHLYRIFENKDEDKANFYKKDIADNFSSSIYAEMIGEKVPVKNEDFQQNRRLAEEFYEEVYCNYDYLKYDLAIEKCNNAIENYKNQVIISKFELLKAYAIGKKYGVEAFVKALEYVSLNYPNTKEGQKAKKMSVKLLEQKIN